MKTSNINYSGDLWGEFDRVLTPFKKGEVKKYNRATNSNLEGRFPFEGDKTPSTEGGFKHRTKSGKLIERRRPLKGKVSPLLRESLESRKQEKRLLQEEVISEKDLDLLTFL